MYLEQVALIVDDYDVAIEFFVEKLGFDLVEDSPALTNDGRPKRTEAYGRVAVFLDISGNRWDLIGAATT